MKQTKEDKLLAEAYYQVVESALGEELSAYLQLVQRDGKLGDRHLVSVVVNNFIDKIEKAGGKIDDTAAEAIKGALGLYGVDTSIFDDVYKDRTQGPMRWHSEIGNK